MKISGYISAADLTDIMRGQVGKLDMRWNFLRIGHKDVAKLAHNGEISHISCIYPSDDHQNCPICDSGWILYDSTTGRLLRSSALILGVFAGFKLIQQPQTDMLSAAMLLTGVL